MPAFLGGIATSLCGCIMGVDSYLEMPAFLGGIATRKYPSLTKSFLFKLEMPAFLGGIATLLSRIAFIMSLSFLKCLLF